MFFAGIYLVKNAKSKIAIQMTKHLILQDSQITKPKINLYCFFHQKEANKTYNCENLDLSEIPGTLPNSTESLDFSFNFLPAIQNTTFSRLINLTFLDLTRYVSEFLCILDVLLK